MSIKKWNQGTVLVSGAGLIGLLLAQVLKSKGIPFVIFDRDSHVTARGQGWGITLHWALNDFLSLLPQELQDEVYKAQVYPEFDKNDTGNFIYINATSGEPVVRIPPSKRLRVRREQIRGILLKGIDVNWDCQAVDINTNATDGVTVTCKNGKVFKGSLLVGAEGSNSITRSFTNPNDHQLYYLPTRFIGGTVALSCEEYDRLAKDFDPLLFQGTIPKTETFFWFSLLASPQYTGDSDKYLAQVNFSWGIEIENRSEEPFETALDRANAIQKRVEGLNPKLTYLVDRLLKAPNELVELKLADWPKSEWNDFNSRILLAGDAAHAMVMYRGEAANHGITDVKLLSNLIDLVQDQTITWEQAVADYKISLKTRCESASLLSRQACLDAHTWAKINAESGSPLLSPRKKTID